MKPNYKTELNAVLVQKHLTSLKAKKIQKELAEITETADALSVLAGKPYDFWNTHVENEQLRMDIDGKINFPLNGQDLGRYHLLRKIAAVDELMQEHHPVTDELLEAYIGVLFDLLEYSEKNEKPIPAWRFYLRVYCNDDIDDFISGIRKEFGPKD